MQTAPGSAMQTTLSSNDHDTTMSMPVVTLGRDNQTRLRQSMHTLCKIDPNLANPLCIEQVHMHGYIFFQQQLLGTQNPWDADQECMHVPHMSQGFAA